MSLQIPEERSVSHVTQLTMSLRRPGRERETIEYISFTNSALDLEGKDRPGDEASWKLPHSNFSVNCLASTLHSTCKLVT